MNTLILIELVPGIEQQKTLQLLVSDQLRVSCPAENCLVATYELGTDHQKLLDMAKEVDQRAHLAMTTDNVKSLAIDQCAYIAVRSIPFGLMDSEYELGALLMVFLKRDRIMRRFAVPDYENDTPAEVVVALDEELQLAEQTLTQPVASRQEEHMAGQIADAVIGGFADYYKVCTGQIC